MQKIVGITLKDRLVIIHGFRDDISLEWLYDIAHFGFVIVGDFPGHMEIINERDILHIQITTEEDDYDVKKDFSQTSVKVIHYADVTALYTMEQCKTRKESINASN